MSHTLSICTPTPFVQFCYNVNNDINTYTSYHIDTPLLHYTYIPESNSESCNTTTVNNTIITKCPNVTTTVQLPQLLQHDIKSPSIYDMKQQLNTIENLLQNTKNKLLTMNSTNIFNRSQTNSKNQNSEQPNNNNLISSRISNSSNSSNSSNRINSKNLTRLNNNNLIRSRISRSSNKFINSKISKYLPKTFGSRRSLNYKSNIHKFINYKSNVHRFVNSKLYIRKCINYKSISRYLNNSINSRSNISKSLKYKSGIQKIFNHTSENRISPNHSSNGGGGFQRCGPAFNSYKEAIRASRRKPR
jgi:hypothetical protein